MNGVDPVAPAAPPQANGVTVPRSHDPYSDGDGLFEVVGGVRVEKPMNALEQTIATLLIGRLEPFCRENQLGRAFVETLIALAGSGNDRKPDVAFVSFQRWGQTRPVPRVNAWPVVPELAVEVISPTDKAFDVMDKVREYFAAGVQLVWHVYSNIEQVLVFTSPTQIRVLNRGDELVGAPIVPGFRMALADLFPVSSPNP